MASRCTDRPGPGEVWAPSVQWGQAQKITPGVEEEPEGISYPLPASCPPRPPCTWGIPLTPTLDRATYQLPEPIMQTFLPAMVLLFCPSQLVPHSPAPLPARSI